jgi:hypothetical protein
MIGMRIITRLFRKTGRSWRLSRKSVIAVIKNIMADAF